MKIVFNRRVHMNDKCLFSDTDIISKVLESDSYSDRNMDT